MLVCDHPHMHLQGMLWTGIEPSALLINTNICGEPRVMIVRMMNVESKQCEFSVPRIRTKVLLYIRIAKVKNYLCATHDGSLEEQTYSSIHS
jgi:hypothetical protein